jgi:hypothetical protein
MNAYHIYYMQPTWFRDGICGAMPTIASLTQTHTFLRTVEAESLNQVFALSQGEVWSPNGEARSLIRSKGLEHTSMSVGDIAEDTATGAFYVVAMMGFREIPLLVLADAEAV